MLTFAQYIALNPQPTSRDVGALYQAYIDWFLDNSGKPKTKDSLERHPAIQPEGLFVHLVVQLKLIGEFSQTSAIPQESGETIAQRKKAIEDILNPWLKEIDAAMYVHVLAAVNADRARRNRIFSGLLALAFLTLTPLAIVAGLYAHTSASLLHGSLFLIAAVFSGMMAVMSVLALTLNSVIESPYPPRTEIDEPYEFHPQPYISASEMIAVDMYKSYWQLRYTYPPTFWKVDEYDEVRSVFELKRNAVLTFTETLRNKNAATISETISKTINLNNNDSDNKHPVKALVGELVTQRYSRKYITYTQDGDEYRKQMLNRDNGGPVLNLSKATI